MITRLRAWWHRVYDEPDLVCVPLEWWHQTHERIRKLETENALLREMMGRR
jgi:hypothetical protein